MKYQKKKLRWAILIPAFVLLASFANLLISPAPAHAADCSTLYTQGTNEYNVCQEGANNKTDAAYCDLYKNTAAHEPCLNGHGNTQTPSTPSQTTPNCNRYPTGTNEYNICNEAYTKATDDTYCNQYSGSAAYDPCYVGQMSKLGRDATPPSQSNDDIYSRSGVDSWCANKYSDSNSANACKEGAKNMGTRNYCDKYQGTAAHEPCKSGWDYAQKWAQDNGATIINTTPPNSEQNGNNTCVIPYIGWAICPILLAVSKGVDGAYNVVEGILETPVSIFTESGTNGVGEVYGKFLNVANIVLAIIFLIIIIAQAIPGFLPNYTIKKYLPKFIIAAVAINVAFHACAAVVDLTNIVGKSIPSFFSGLTSQTTQTVPGDWTIPTIGSSGAGQFGSATGNANNFGDFTGSILAGTAVIGGIALFSAGGLAPIGWAILMFLIPIVLGAILAILAILLALVLRSALIIILVVISPLAFTALALPNTEKLFSKWWGLFYKLLLLYPIVALVFGGSKLAGSILMNVATASGGTVAGAFLALAASAATILPLILVPGLLKGAISATGKLGQKIEGLADKGYSGAKTLADKRMKESGTGQYYTKKSETDKGLRAGGYSLSDRKKSLRSMPSRRDWRRAYGTGIADKVDDEYSKNYDVLLNSDTAGMSFNDQLSHFQAEFVKASAAQDFGKASVLMEKLSVTEPGRKKLREAMQTNNIAFGNKEFDNKVRSYIGAHKANFVKDARLWQFTRRGGEGYENIDLNSPVDVIDIGLSDTEIASQSDSNMEFLRNVSKERAARILADTKADLNQKQRDALENATKNAHNMNIKLPPKPKNNAP